MRPGLKAGENVMKAKLCWFSEERGVRWGLVCPACGRGFNMSYYTGGVRAFGPFLMIRCPACKKELLF